MDTNRPRIIEVCFSDPQHKSAFNRQVARLLAQGWEIVAKTENSTTFRRGDSTPDSPVLEIQ